MSKVKVELISEVKAVQDVPVVLCVYGFGTFGTAGTPETDGT